MRLFIAVDLDEVARAAIGDLAQRLSRRLDHGGLRWTKPEQLHLTLAFVGEVDEATFAAVNAQMTPVISMAPYEVAFGGLGVFPARGSPRVLWIGATAGARETIDLQRHIAGRVRVAGVELEARPFQPHLTIGRYRDSGERDRRAVVEVADTGEIARVPVDHVTLYESRLSSAGATHTALSTTALVARA